VSLVDVVNQPRPLSVKMRQYSVGAELIATFTNKHINAYKTTILIKRDTEY